MPTNRPSNYNRSSIQRNNAATIARQDEALRLRQSGMSFIEIARTLGYTPNGVPRPQSAAEAVRAAERRLAQRNAYPGLLLGNNAPTPTVQPSAPVGVRRSLYNRTFGVEVEFFGITATVAHRALTAAGLLSAVEGYNHQTRPHWKFVTDASVTSTGTGVGSGLEMVSPVLRGASGFAELTTAVKALLNAGAKTDKSCGIHVHIGADAMTGLDIMRLIDLYTANGQHIDTVLAASRHNTRWAVKYTNTMLAHFRQALTPATNANALRTVSSNMNNNRYHTVNVASYSRHGTVEFRQHQGSLNAEKIASWAKFVMLLTDRAIAMTDSEVADFGSLGALMDTIGLDDTTKGYLARRSVAMATTR
jgi:hypothetical protein